MRGAVPGSYAGLGCRFSPTARLENAMINGALATTLRGTFPQQWETNLSNVNASLDPANKSEKQGPER